MQSERDRVGPTLGLPTSLLQDIEERVWRGAELLDRKRPGWFERIDLSRLQLSDCRHCVIGQSVGNYQWSEEGSAFVGSLRDGPESYGFTLAQYALPGGWSYLDACWTDAVNERRAGA